MVQMDNDSLEAGRMLANPPPGEEVVITGISGAFPDSDTVTEFADKLYNKVDLISGDGRRWTLGEVNFFLIASSFRFSIFRNHEFRKKRLLILPFFNNSFQLRSN